MNIISISCITGFVGDALLQLGVSLGMGGPDGWGLRPYFKQHGSIESLFIAGGMMTIFYVIYAWFSAFTYTRLAVYGIILDLIFRETMLFPSLQGYYNHLNYFWSAFWGAVPLMLPLFISKNLVPK